MSFIGRAAVWAPEGATDGDTIEINQARRGSGVLHTGARFTPLSMLTGSRIAANGGVVRWVGGDTWGEPVHAQSRGPRLADQLRKPYRQIFAAFTRQPAGPPEIRVCPRCGQAPHTDWGYEYERLVCQEITAA
jgi:hypothetical protein